MHIIYDDKKADRSPDSFQLILITSGWHIVANGYLCKVADAEEGLRVIAALQSRHRREQPGANA